MFRLRPQGPRLVMAAEELQQHESLTDMTSRLVLDNLRFAEPNREFANLVQGVQLIFDHDNIPRFRITLQFLLSQADVAAIRRILVRNAQFFIDDGQWRQYGAPIATPNLPSAICVPRQLMFPNQINGDHYVDVNCEYYHIDPLA